MRALSPILFILTTAVLLAGCLPGQQRTSPRDLFPADSLSRQLAEATPTDTLDMVWRTRLPPNVRYPMTMAWEGGRILVADLQTGGLHTLEEDGTYVAGFEDERLEFPLLSGVRGDTVAVLSRGSGRLELITLDRAGRGAFVESIPVPGGHNQVAAWSERGLFVKTADEERGSAIYEIDRRKDVTTTFPLDPPYWRHIGFLRMWGDSLISLSGYRPVVRVLPVGAQEGATPDTLALMGFDSPQLARSRQFVLGDLREPPLLVPSALAIGERLFVLNARPGWVHVDVFRRGDGELRLERSLLSPEAAMDRNYFASDLAVQQTAIGFDIVVLEARPLRSVVRYRWEPDDNTRALQHVSTSTR